MIRIGRSIYSRDGKRTDPCFHNFEPIIVLTKSSKYGSLSPYEVKDIKGRRIENIWQFSKVYPVVPYIKLNESRYSSKVVWEHPLEKHIISKVNKNEIYSWSEEKIKQNLTNDFYNWRRKGMENNEPVRYPVGFNNKGDCICAFSENEDESINYKPLDYISARKIIYLPIYIKYVKQKSQFKELKQKLKDGKNLLIIEVDGPHQESLEYYKNLYNVKDDFIQNNTILATKENLDIMLNDTKHNFGHGYCLALALLE